MAESFKQRQGLLPFVQKKTHKPGDLRHELFKAC